MIGIPVMAMIFAGATRDPVTAFNGAPFAAAASFCQRRAAGLAGAEISRPNTSKTQTRETEYVIWTSSFKPLSAL